MRRNVLRVVCVVPVVLLTGSCTPAKANRWITPYDGAQIAILRNDSATARAIPAPVPVRVRVCMKRSADSINVVIIDALHPKSVIVSLPNAGGCIERERPHSMWVQRQGTPSDSVIAGTYTVTADDRKLTEGADARVAVSCTRFADTTPTWWGHCEVPQAVRLRRFCFQAGFVRAGAQSIAFNQRLLLMVVDTSLYRDPAPEFANNLVFNELLVGGCRDMYDPRVVGILIRKSTAAIQPDSLIIRIRPLELR